MVSHKLSQICIQYPCLFILLLVALYETIYYQHITDLTLNYRPILHYLLMLICFIYNVPPFLFFYRFLFTSLIINQKVHVLLCKVGQRLLCAQQCHWIDVIRNSVNVGFSQLIRGNKQTYTFCTVIASRRTTKHNKVTH